MRGLVSLTGGAACPAFSSLTALTALTAEGPCEPAEPQPSVSPKTKETR
jgi:hypothetical protein